MRSRRIALVLLAALGVFSVSREPAPRPVFSNRYPAGSFGWDASYPQCGRSIPPPGTFGVVGLNGGRPFTRNRCLTTEWDWADGLLAPSLYVNVAFSPIYLRHVTPACRSSVPTSIVADAERQAWAIGCAEATYVLANAPGRPSMWWLDVETANSWSKHHRLLNRLAIQAAVDELRRRTDLPIGLYSYAVAWRRITGARTWTPAGASANWLAPTVRVSPATADERCGTGFSGLPVALVQFLVKDSGGAYDADYVC